jgi:hypothetical protein
MRSSANAEGLICERLRKFGYTRDRHIRLYGEEFQLVSNPFPDGEGFAVEGIAHASGQLRRMRIPLSLVQTLRRELALHERTEIAA